MAKQKKPGTNNGQQFTRREFLKAGGAILGSVVLFNSLASCTQQESTKTTNTATGPTTGSTNPSPSTSSSTPQYGGTLRMITQASAPVNIGWPPEMVMSAGATGINQDICETLLRGDSKGGVNPWLAESYKIADDLSSMTFNLRKGVKFHDGSIFNGEVAKWNLENYIETKVSPYDKWDSVDLIDDYTVRVNFNKWVCTLPSSFVEGNPFAPMVSKEAFDNNGVAWMRTHAIGTGAFRFESTTQDVGLREVKNPDYWQQGKPYLDSIDMLFIADATTQKMEMQVGDAELAQFHSGKMAHDYAAMGLKVDIYSSGNNYLIPDTANPDSPFANLKVREAIEYSIDREAIAKAFSFGFAKAPYQIPPGVSAACNPDFKLARKFDPEKAKQLLDEAGYTGSPRLKTTIIVGPFTLSTTRDPIIAVQSNLADVGIQADLEFPDMGKWMTYTGPGSWPKGTLLCGVSLFDVSFITGIQFIDNMTGTSWLRTPEFKQAVQTALSAPTQDINLVRAATDILTKDASFIPITEDTQGYAKQPNVNATFNERAGPAFWNTENFWLNT